MLKSCQDAFGQMLLAYYENKPAQEIIERDDGLIDVAGGLPMYFAEYENWYPLEKEAMRYVRQGRVLDIGCGAGRTALYLQALGFQVTGIDISPLAVEVCRRRGVNDVRLLSITKVSRSLGIFDTIVMMGNNWGLMGSFRRARWLLRRFSAITTADARIIAFTTDPYRTADPFHKAYHEHNRLKGRMGGQVRIRCRFKTYIGPWFDYLLVSKEEMASILQDSDWGVERYIEGEGPFYAVVLEKLRAQA